MRKLFTLAALLLALSGFAQKGNIKPLKVVVLKPDTAIIESSLNKNKDSLRLAHINHFYRYLKAFEERASCTTCDFDKEDVVRYKKMASDLKAQESEIKNYKYFQLFSFYAKAIYDYYYQTDEIPSSFVEPKNTSTKLAALKSVADEENADYVVYFSNIKSSRPNNVLQLNVTTSVFSRKESMVIYSKETVGDLKNRGNLWECDSPLGCLIINAVRTSTDEVANLLKNLQLKNKQ
jgi:hypothetical protein